MSWTFPDAQRRGLGGGGDGSDVRGADVVFDANNDNDDDDDESAVTIVFVGSKTSIMRGDGINERDNDDEEDEWL